MLTNAGLYVDWFRTHKERDLFNADPWAARLLKPDERSGLFHVKDVACLLPFLRVLWRWPDSVARLLQRADPEPSADTYCPPSSGTGWEHLHQRVLREKAGLKAVSLGAWRYMTAPEVLDWLWVEAANIPAVARMSWFVRNLRSAMKAWLVTVDQELLRQTILLDSRVEAIAVSRPKLPKHLIEVEGERGLQRQDRGYRWTRAGDRFPQEMRYAPPGLDPVHTPETDRAGLSRYLTVGWSIDDRQRLIPNGKNIFGESSNAVLHHLNDAPRRLMLGASMQSRSVPVAGGANPATEQFYQFHIPGVRLRCAFSFDGGWTHEDAVVISESAAQVLRRVDRHTYYLYVPALASRLDWEVAIGDRIATGQTLVRAFLDLYALGLNQIDVQNLAWPGPLNDGWMEVEVRHGEAPCSGKVESFADAGEADPYWRRVRIIIQQDSPLQVGDKIATPHGIKGVVSAVRADEIMPAVPGGRAQILLNPAGVARRGALGQYREAAGHELLGRPVFAGDVFVTRQPHDAAPKCHVCGPTPCRVRAQRYGELEFIVLMAHQAEDIAGELLSRHRSNSKWLACESKIAESTGDGTSAQELATAALNRYLGLLGMSYEGGRLEFDICDVEGQRTLSLGLGGDIHSSVSSVDSTALLELRRNLEHNEYFLSRQGSVGIRFDEPVILHMPLATDAGRSLRIQIGYLPVLPPWLIPSSKDQRNQIAHAYLSLIGTLRARLTPENVRTPRRQREAGRSVGALCRWILELALGDRYGAGAFLKREVLGRRLNRSARAVIVPRPDLAIDQIAIPAHILDELVRGAPDPEASRRVVLVNRNPTLHRRSILALRPVVDPTPDSNVFGMPLPVLGVLGADFDGDQVSVVVLETAAALREAERLLPGYHDPTGRFPSLRFAPWRSEATSDCAFKLANELSDDGAGEPGAEKRIAMHIDEGQRDWVRRHYSELLAPRLEHLASVQDPATWPFFKDKWEENLRWSRIEDDDTYRREVPTEMGKLFRTIPKKRQYGGLLRHEFYKRRFGGVRSEFFQAVDALSTLTERLMQSALSSKRGSVKEVKARAVFENPPGASGREDLQNVDSNLDLPELLKAIDEPALPTGILAWMAKPTLATLARIAREQVAMEGTDLAPDNDPRIAWYLSCRRTPLG